MATTVMVWKTNAFGSFRVTIEKVSVNGMATLVKFMRDARYRPAESGEDGTMWVASSTLHKATPKGTGLAKVEPSYATTTTKPAKKAPRKATGTAARAPKGSTTAQFTSF